MLILKAFRILLLMLKHLYYSFIFVDIHMHVSHSRMSHFRCGDMSERARFFYVDVIGLFGFSQINKMFRSVVCLFILVLLLPFYFGPHVSMSRGYTRNVCTFTIWLWSMKYSLLIVKCDSFSSDMNTNICLKWVCIQILTLIWRANISAATM